MCVYICMYVYIYIYIYIHTNCSKPKWEPRGLPPTVRVERAAATTRTVTTQIE